MAIDFDFNFQEQQNREYEKMMVKLRPLWVKHVFVECYKETCTTRIVLKNGFEKTFSGKLSVEEIINKVKM